MPDAFGNALGQALASSRGSVETQKLSGSDTVVVAAGNSSVITDASNPYDGVSFGQPRLRTSTDDAMFNLLTEQMRNPNAEVGSRIVLDDFGSPVTNITEPRSSFDQNRRPLYLGSNEIFRKDIEFAAVRTGIDPAGLASIIDAEAAKIHGRWNENSTNPSGAAGLTQFMPRTWVSEAQRDGTYLNQIAREQGLIDKNNQVTEGLREQLLNLRYNPTLSITAAAEMANRNINTLRAEGYIPSNASANELARYAYYAHHEGLQGARLFLENRTTVSDKKWQQNVPVSQRQTLLQEANGDRNLAYMNWLRTYTNSKIQPERFRR